ALQILHLFKCLLGRAGAFTFGFGHVSLGKSSVSQAVPAAAACAARLDRYRRAPMAHGAHSAGPLHSTHCALLPANQARSQKSEASEIALSWAGHCADRNRSDTASSDRE